MIPIRITLTLVVTLILANLSCKKEKGSFKELSCPVATVVGKKDQIVGKWKLVSGYYESQIEGTPTTKNDYSCSNIIYEFKSDGKLVVISDITDYVGNDPGTVDYEFSTKGGNLLSLTIDSDEQDAVLSSTTLDINNSSSDGWVLKLVRIE